MPKDEAPTIVGASLSIETAASGQQLSYETTVEEMPEFCYNRSVASCIPAKCRGCIRRINKAAEDIGVRMTVQGRPGRKGEQNGRVEFVLFCLICRPRRCSFA